MIMSYQYEVFSGTDTEGDACIYVQQDDTYLDDERATCIAAILAEVLNTLRNVEGPVTIHGGIVSLEDGSKIDLNEHLPQLKCEDCGGKFYSLIGCPDGAEICLTCFDAGGH